MLNRRHSRTSCWSVLSGSASASVATTRVSMTRRTLEEVDRRRIAFNQGWICNLCDCTLDPHFEIDHIKALCNKGKDELSNMQALCGSCHSAKTVNDRRIFRAKGSFFRCFLCDRVVSTYFVHKCKNKSKNTLRVSSKRKQKGGRRGL